MSRLAYTDGMAADETSDNTPPGMYEHYPYKAPGKPKPA
jgi:hypothetical protein